MTPARSNSNKKSLRDTASYSTAGGALAVLTGWIWGMYSGEPMPGEVTAAFTVIYGVLIQGAVWFVESLQR